MEKKLMKALVKKKPELGGIIIEEVPYPSMNDLDVIIKVNKTSICGTDVHIYNWDNWAKETINLPLVIGHEFVGTIVELGKNVTGFKVGQLVTAEGHITCGRCRNCLIGKRHLCKNIIGIGVNRQGAFAEYISVPSSNIWLCDNSLSTDIISCFDPLGNAVHSVFEHDIVGKNVIITGAGPIGIMSVAILRNSGASNVVITDINPYRLNLAKKMGATAAINIKTQNIKNTMMALNIKDGFDIGLEMSGTESGLKQIINVMNNGGEISLLGIQESNIDFDINDLVFKGLTIKGIYGRKIFDSWFKIKDLFNLGMNMDLVITHKFSYKEFEKGFELMRCGEAGKIVLVWE